MDVRVQDYLDDRIQTAADLETLDSLIENVKGQQELLRKQLEDAIRDHDEAREQTTTHSQSIQLRGDAFQKEQRDIDRRLMIVTQSETSDDAVRKFEHSMDKLRQLEVASGYVELLKEVDTLRSDSLSKLGEDNDGALEPYQRLQKLANSIQPLQDAAEGAAPHLLDHIAQQALTLQQSVQTSFSSDLEKVLRKMNWPKTISTVPLALENEWAVSLRRLLDLQWPHLEEHEAQAKLHRRSLDTPVLFPLQVMVKPLEQRFGYHFSGNKPTNRLDKPEYFLSHIIDQVSTYLDFLQNALQPLLIQHFRGSDLAFTPAYVDATTAFITALLPMLRVKLSSVAKQVSTQPQLLSHLMHEVMSFDTTLQETFAYSPESPSIPWQGMANFLLDSCGYFDQWLAAERDFALSRYQSIIENPDSGELDFDSVGSDATKPTKAAIRVNDLLETITDRYRTLTSFGQKLRFLIDIQIAIFDRYHARLHSGLEAYLTMTSSIGRTVHSMTRDEQTELQGVKGVDRLCRIFGSADYLERAMRDWSDDVFFLELWEDLQDRARSRDRTSLDVGALHEIQSKTSSAVGGDDQEGRVQGALFDETAAAYHRLRVRSESIIVETLAYNMREALRAFSRVNTWASLSSATAGGSSTAELDPAIRLLQEYLGFLSKALGRAPLRRVSRQLSRTIETYIWDAVLLRHSFSTAGATQLAADIGGVCSIIDRFVGPDEGRNGMRKLLEGVTLLNLPVRGEVSRESSAKGSGDGEETLAWEDENGDATSDAKRPLGLFEVERLVFMDNESARRALDQLGIDRLDGNDARAVLEKRIELHS